MMIVLGRPLRSNEYPDGMSMLLTEVIEIAQIRGSATFASGLEAFLARTLPLSTQRPHASAVEAAGEVRLVAREIGVARCRAALTAFVGDMNRVLADAANARRWPAIQSRTPLMRRLRPTRSSSTSRRLPSARGSAGRNLTRNSGPRCGHGVTGV